MSMGSLEEQLRPQLLSGLAYERLLEEIVSGRLPRGHRLRLDLLAHSWAVSRTPVREALQRLADMRFVHVSPNAGTRVAEWSAVDMIERARIVGRLLAGESSCLSAAADPQQTIVTRAPECELRGYLDLASHLIESEFSRLGPRIVREYVEPLRLFVNPDTAAAHGIELDRGRDRRRELLSAARAALHRDDPAAARDALAALSAQVISALESSAPAPERSGAPQSPRKKTHDSVHKSALGATHRELMRKATP